VKKYQVLGIGNAIVDVIASAEDTFLDHMGIQKGIMQLVERDRAEVLYAAMTGRNEKPGGSVANTIAGLGNLGLDTAFVGRVRDDALGRFYADAMAADGTDFVNPPVKEADVPTSRSMIFVSPDGERSMNTYLGVSADLGVSDLPQDVTAEVVFLEGYLFDKPQGKEAFKATARTCQEAGGLAGIAISDPFCVERHRADFLDLIKNELGYVIGNRDEIRALYETDDLDAALSKISDINPFVVCTRSEDGCTIIRDGERVDVTTTPVVPVDATGAGDAFAAGFLYGLVTGKDMETAGKMGCATASEIIAQIGPRTDRALAELFAEKGLL